MSAIPGIGDTVALAKKSVNAVKDGLKTLKGIKNINALKKAKGIKKALAGMRGKAKTGASRLKKGKIKKKGKLEPPDEAIDAIKKGQKKKCLTDKCFTGDTLVYTRHGYKPIKEIRKGDEVYSRDEKTGETGFKEVVEVFCTTAHTIYHIWIEGKEGFKTTAYHPVYVQEQGWVTAINLREGDTIETMDGFVHITKVERTRHEEPVPVYNFHVKDWVSYFVGAAMVYVHNSPGEHIGSLESIIKNGKVSIDDLKANPKVFSGKSVDDIAHALTDSGYDVTIKKSTRSKSGAQNIIINNPGNGKNIVKVQVSPGGGRHGKNPYVEISTIDQGKIKMVDGPKSLYKTDGKETATIIFSGGN